MWNISTEAKERFAQNNLLPIHESEEDWENAIREAKEEDEDLFATLKEELDEVREQLKHVLPNRFIPYLENDTLNHPSLPKAVREDYLEWMRKGDQEFEQILEAASENTQHAIPFLSAEAQEVFNESFHDSTIERMDRDGDSLHVYINTDGGFSSKALMHLIFKGILSEETDVPLQVGQWFIYDELQKTDDGFAFRVLFECPDSQWTISASEIDARYFYRPKQFTLLQDKDQLENMSLDEYVSMLDTEYSYWFITPDAEFKVHLQSGAFVIENGTLEMNENEMIVIAGNEKFTYDLDEYSPLQFIYTNIYESPYEHLKKPVPADELEAAALSDDLEMQVRAWNTLYSNPEEFVDIIHSILMKVEITEENEMMLHVYVRHFDKTGVLTEELRERFKSIME